MRILGIDLGSSSIKAVEMDSAFGRFDIHDYHEHPLTDQVSAESAISNLMKNLAKPPDRIITSLPNGQTTFRNLLLPTRDKKAIQASVGFELEDELPFSSEDSIFDYSILTQTKGGSTIHVVATLKRYLLSLVETWKKAYAEPDVITTETWAYRALLNRLLGGLNQDAPVLLIQAGHSKTIFYLHWRGTPALIREIAWGGKDLTAAISQKYGIPMDQAEAQKIDHGFIVSGSAPRADQTAEQREFSACLEASLEGLSQELKQIELTSKSITRHNLSLIYLAGGTSLLPGLGGWIEKKMQVPTKPLLSLSSATASGVTYSDQTDARFILAAALTFSLVGPERAACANFRKGEYSKEGKSRDFNIRTFRKPLMALGTVSFCLFLSLFVQTRVYRSRLTETDLFLEKSMRTFFGQLSSSALRTYMSNTSTLRASINKELNKQRELSKLFGPNPRSPLDFLNSLSKGIPKDVVVDMIQYQTGSSATEPFTSSDLNSSTSLTFVVSNPQVAEKLARYVGTKVGNAQRSKMEEISPPDESPKKWKITFTGKPNEDTYGK